MARGGGESFKCETKWRVADCSSISLFLAKLSEKAAQISAMKNLLTKSFLDYADLNEEAMKDLDAGGGDENQDRREESQKNESLRVFYEEVELVKKEMESIGKLLALLTAANEESISAWPQDVVRAARNRMDRLVLEVVQIALRIRGCLQDMDRSNAANRHLPGCSEGSAVDRSRTVLTNMLRRKLKELLMDFQRVRQSIREDFMMDVRRRYHTVTGEIPSDELLEKMFAEGKSEEILRTTLYSSGRGKVTETVSEIQDRYHSAKDLENSLLELQQLFVDLAVLVDSQGDKMNEIEHHVSNAAEYITAGTNELNSASTYQRRSHKWLCMAIILLLILVLLVVILLLGY